MIARRKLELSFLTRSGVCLILKGHLQNSSENSRVEKIKTNTLDRFAATEKIGSIDLLKIDTEGYEMPVLNGQSNLKNNSIKLVYLEVGFSKTNVRNTYFADSFNFLNNLGYAFFGFYESIIMILRTKTTLETPCSFITAI